jgi:hypothetical protein
MISSGVEGDNLKFVQSKLYFQPPLFIILNVLFAVLVVVDFPSPPLFGDFQFFSSSAVTPLNTVSL